MCLRVGAGALCMPVIDTGELDALMSEIGRLGGQHRIRALVAGQVMSIT